MSYKSTHTGAQIDAGVSAALNPDATPTLSSTNLVTSGGVAAKLSEKASNTDLALKAPLDSPTFTGTPTAPTPTAGDDSTKVATTAFVRGEIDTADAALEQMILASFPTDSISNAAIASFSDGADNIPVKALTVNITPVQSGSGDPSPANVRPISGWTGANVTRCGKNLFDKSTVVTGELNSTGGINTAATSIRTSAYIKVNPSTEYILYDICSTSNVSYCWAEYDGNKSFISTGTITGTNQKRLTTSATTSYIRVCVLPANLNSCIVVQQHDINPAYSPYSGTVYPVSWQTEAGTVYGGTLTDNGDGTRTLKSRPYYASYNGETLVGPWVSSMDVYAEGTTPTTGAQVVDLGGAETEYTLTAESVRTLLGNNNIFADCGDVNTLTYRADVGLYIAKKLAEA